MPLTKKPGRIFTLDRAKAQQTETIWLSVAQEEKLFRDLISGKNIANPGGFVTDTGGKAATFNGSQQQNLAYSTAAANGLIIAARIKATATQAGNPGAAFGVYSSTAQSGIGVGFDTANNVGAAYLTNAGAGLLASSPGVQNVWYTVFVQLRGGYFTNAWINGKPATINQDVGPGGTFSVHNEISIGAQHRSSGFLRQFKGSIEWAALLAAPSIDSVISNDYAEYLYASDYPYNLEAMPSRIWVASAGAPTIVPLGQVTETDSAQAISVNPQRRTLAQVVETDTAQAITPIGNKIVPLAQATESDTAQAITVNPKRRLVAQAIETDTAQLIAARKTAALLQVAETDTAQALTRVKRRALAQVTETDTAQALTRVKRRALAQVVETDTAQAITPLGAKIVPLAQATETDTTQAITVNPKRRLVAQATETDQAQTITARKTRGLGQATETGTTQSITVNPKRRLVAQVSETDTAQAISAPKRVLLGQATESNTAGAISLLGQTIAKPSSDVLAGAWLPSVGSTLYGAIDEVSADASDYIYTSSASTCSLGLSPAVDPLTSTGQVVRYQAWSPLGNGLTVRLKQGTTTIASWTHAVLPLTPTIWSQPLSAAECDAITDYTALRLDLESL